MALKTLVDYEKYLYGCRFCPMCKPCSEVGNVTYRESHTTRARAMLIWRVLHGASEYSIRDVELLYQTTLDSVSEAWCVNHYPVSGYLLAARRRIFEEGLAPEPVRSILDRLRESGFETSPGGDTVFLACETAENGYVDGRTRYRKMLERLDLDATLLIGCSGLTSFVLGDVEGARGAAERLLGELRSRGTKRIVVDGSDTFYALTRLYPELGLEPPEPAGITTLSRYCVEHAKNRKNKALNGRRVLVHDARSSFLLCDRPPTDEVIQPGFSGPEEALGTGAIYEAPRMLADSLGASRVFSIWTRGLSRSSGADDGLALTYPSLARRVAVKRFEQAEIAGADDIVTDSLAAVALWETLTPAERRGIGSVWMPELV